MKERRVFTDKANIYTCIIDFYVNILECYRIPIYYHALQQEFNSEITNYTERM